jgi:predicted CopG family antitoxin
MAGKTIRVSEETWRKLRARKREGESFDAVIERELEDDDPLAGFGAWSDTTIDESVRGVKGELDDELGEDEGPR